MDKLDTESRTAWISQGFERLAERVRVAPQSLHFDILIIGSGYGGAVAAATLAGRRTAANQPLSVGVLERGNEYLPGSFPTGLGELPRHVRRDKEKEGLFDVRLGTGVATVVANGLGGGSLINAGVMEAPLPSVFANGWPAALAAANTLDPFFERARTMLGAGSAAARNTIEKHPDGLPEKFRSIRDIAGPGTFKAAAISVAMNDSTSSGNVRLNKCVRCGDCATGCNFGAKNSLDVSLLVTANQRGAEIFSGATALRITREAGAWVVHCVHTNAKLRERSGESVAVRAGKVILAAGTLGSTELLMRSQPGLQFSGQLGKRCSTNGDMLVADYATAKAVNTVADETVKPSQRAIGPTITGIIDLRRKHGILIEEMSVPAGLARAFAEVFATVNSLHVLDTFDTSFHTRGFPQDDSHVTSARHVRHSALYAVMGDDGAAGVIELAQSTDPMADGTAVMRWDSLPGHPLFARQVKQLSQIAGKSGGRVIANPLWQLLPAELGWLLRDQRGPLTTVHPLGGCVMADDAAHGVVDHMGRVFSGMNGNAVHDGLVVLDGSIIPTALATNPALTIAAVALRASEELAAQWGLSGQAAAPSATLTRPVFRKTDFAAPPPQTTVEVIERLSGSVTLRPLNRPAQECIAELTLRFEPRNIGHLSPGNGGNPVLDVSANWSGGKKVRSMLRIFPKSQWEALEKQWRTHTAREAELDGMALYKAPLTGTLRIFERQQSNVVGRILRSGWAWTLNRGLRDIHEAICHPDGGPGVFSRIRSGLALASRAGEIRTLTYDLQIGIADPGAAFALDGSRILGKKTFTYERRGNPWRQLMEVTLERFPGMTAGSRKLLKVDPGFLAAIGVPLFRLAGQRDAVAAIGEIASFLSYVARLMIGVHIWSFRSPDKDPDPDRILNFLPPRNLKVANGAKVKAQPIEIALNGVPDLEPPGTPAVGAKVTITRYPRPGTMKRPVVMIHGYSAGGTTFAHDSVNPNFASHLWNSGRDVWVADLRTSPADRGIAKRGWSFDQIGTNDVPKVIAEAAQHSIDGKVDVVAHCMGTVVFSIAALSGELGDMVDRAAFTQVGPLVVFTPANVLRAYVLRYLVEYLPDDYQFRPDNPGLFDDLLDRLLSTLPYPKEEFDYENPILPWKRTPWTRTRHRMDALYGRDFNVANMEPDMLRDIDEHFGALSLRTVATTLHFVRNAVMTDRKGNNNLVSRLRFRTNWDFPTFSVHGSDNGLSHVSTVDRMRTILSDSGRIYLPQFINPGAGHQDALVGTKRHATFQQVTQFLDANITAPASNGNTAKVAYPPWLGPVITEELPHHDGLVIRLGAMPSHREAEGVILLRVFVSGDQILRPDDPGLPWDEQYILDHMEYVSPPGLKLQRWAEFEAPLPQEMQNHNPLHPGNALLVLLVYDESPDLLPAVYRRNSQTFNLESMPVFSDAASRPRRFMEFKPVKNQKMVDLPAVATAGLAALNKHALLHRAPAHMDLLSANVTAGASDARAAQATLETLLNMDTDLSAGIIPHDPRVNPPNLPDPAGTSFALASCQYPAGLFDATIAFSGYARIAGRLRSGAGIVPRFMLFAGDQVYVDPTAGLYDPSNLDDRYRLPYENWLRDENVRTVLRQIPSFMLLDDHEIADNWEPVADPDKLYNTRTRVLGVDAFHKYQRGLKKELEEFTFDGYPFFMLDTRSGRTHRELGNLANAALFHKDRMDALKAFLTRTSGPKFVLSPLMLLPRHARAVQRDTRLDSGNLSALHSDGWDGYPQTMREVLGFIAENGIANVVFLSGDEHRACIATAQLTDGANKTLTRIHSIHTSAMYSPFPFANSMDEQFVDSETIKFQHGAKNYGCIVNTARPARGDGATFFFVRPSGGQWLLDCEFSDGSRQTLTL